MIDTVPPYGHRSPVRTSPERLRRAWAGTAEFNHGTSTVRAQLEATGRAGPPSTSPHQHHASAFADIPRYVALLTKTDASRGPRGTTSMGGSPLGPVAPTTAGAIGTRSPAAPITRSTAGAAEDPAEERSAEPDHRGAAVPCPFGRTIYAKAWRSTRHE